MSTTTTTASVSTLKDANCRFGAERKFSKSLTFKKNFHCLRQNSIHFWPKSGQSFWPFVKRPKQLISETEINYFWLFLNKQNNFCNKLMWKSREKIMLWDSNPRPLEHEFPLKTTSRPGLPVDIFGCLECSLNHKWLIVNLWDCQFESHSCDGFIQWWDPKNSRGNIPMCVHQTNLAW